MTLEWKKREKNERKNKIKVKMLRVRREVVCTDKTIKSILIRNIIKY